MNLKEKFYDRLGFKRENTVNSMKANPELRAGNIVKVAETGYFYDIKSTSTSIPLNNGLFAEVKQTTFLQIVTKCVDNLNDLIDSFNSLKNSHETLEKDYAAHTHTPSQIGLGNVDNTADLDKKVLSAKKLETPRALKIGGTEKKFDATKDLEWSLHEIGASPSDHTHSSSQVGIGVTTLWSGSIYSGSISINDIASYGLISIKLTSESGLKMLPLTFNPNNFMNETIRITVPANQDISIKVTSTGLTITHNFYNNSYIRSVIGIKL